MKVKTDLIRKDLKELLDGLALLGVWTVFALLIGAIPIYLLEKANRPTLLFEKLTMGMTFGSMTMVLILILFKNYVEDV